MGQAGTPSSRLALLFEAGERLGWHFRDRWQFLRPFPEPQPAPTPVPHHLHARLQRARMALVRRLAITLGVGIGLSVLLLCVGGCLGGMIITDPSAPPGLAEPADTTMDTVATVLAGLAVLVIVVSIVIAGLILLNRLLAARAIRRAERESRHEFETATAAWRQRATLFQQEEWNRVNAMVEWGAARTAEGTRRIDVIGGSLWGWEAFLTVFGASMMGTRGSMTVLDLSGESVCAELVRLSSAAGAGVAVQRLPADLVTSDLLIGLDKRQLVDSLVEAMHGDDPAANRADRAMDDRLLTAICDAIAPELTFARLSAALHTLMGEPGVRPELSDDERLRLADDIFSDEYRRQAHGHLRRIDSYIYPLQELGTQAAPREDGFLSCVTLDSDGRNVRSELLVDLLVQRTTRRMLATDPPRTLVVVGADDLQRRHLERLSDICERRDIRLVLLFRHLRETSAHLVGGGAVAFMRLGNHEEATRAADFIGRHHKFVISQLTNTLGGSETHTDTETEGEAKTESLSIGTVRSRFSNWSRGGSTGEGPGGLTDSSSWSRGGGRSFSESRTMGWSMTRNWSVAQSRAEGTNWSTAQGQQRVYEYAVEPTTLQHLPDYAMLLVQGRPGQLTCHPVECDPAIITLPHASHEPLPPSPPTPPAPLQRYGTPGLAPPMAVGPTGYPTSGIPGAPQYPTVPPYPPPVPPHHPGWQPPRQS